MLHKNVPYVLLKFNACISSSLPLKFKGNVHTLCQSLLVDNSFHSTNITYIYHTLFITHQLFITVNMCVMLGVTGVTVVSGSTSSNQTGAK